MDSSGRSARRPGGNEGHKAPGRGDALLGCIMCGPRISGGVTRDEEKKDATAEADFSEGIVMEF